MYGMRAAVEEVLLQADTLNFNPVQFVKEEPSATPSTLLQGIRVHSGDLLVSRGGAEVSAFISRGNDYPGNFSHVALLHVSEDGNASFIEAHIEKGVAIATAEEYLKDKKLRFMVLRPRADLAQLKENPLLPHQAATSHHIYKQRKQKTAISPTILKWIFMIQPLCSVQRLDRLSTRNTVSSFGKRSQPFLQPVRHNG